MRDESSPRPSNRVIIFQGAPLRVDPDYVIPLIHNALIDTEPTSLDDSIKLGMMPHPFNPQKIIQTFARLDRDLLKR